MRRIISLLLVISLLGVAFTATAEEQSIQIDIDSRRLTLDFDPSTAYSFINNDHAQASFYAYVDGMEHLYELFIVFPANVQSGASITPESVQADDISTSVVLIESTDSAQTYYIAGQVEGELYPSGSHYTISVESVSESDGVRSYSGHLSANIVELNLSDGSTGRTFTIDNAPFNFALTLDTTPESDYNPFDDIPEETPAPGSAAKPLPTSTLDDRVWKI